MKLYKAILLIIALSLTSFNLSAQNNLTKPEKGNAVVYFVRTNSAGLLINFKFFNKDEYIGKFSGTNFLRYECKPGKHVLWSKAENIDFVEADLKAGGIYIIEAKGIVGAFKSGVKLHLVDYNNTRQIKQIYKVLNTKSGIKPDKVKLQKEFDRKEEGIIESMKKIHKKRARKPEKVKKITPNMTFQNAV